MRALLFVTLLLSTFCLSSQVTTTKYSVEYNEETNLFDCFLLIGSGSTRPDKQTDRILFNSQFTVVSHIGTDVSIAELNMPLLNNIDGNGTDPSTWVIANTYSSPVERPDLKFHSIIPMLAPVAHFNNLTGGNKVRLFSLSATPIDTCEYKLRMFDNKNDKYTFDGIDFSNGFTMGGITQLHLGIVEDNFVGGEGPELMLESNSYCEASTALIGQPTMDTWKTSDISVAVFDEEVLTLLSPGEFYIWLLENSTQCNSNLSNIQKVLQIPDITVIGNNSMVVGDTLLLESVTDVVWVSSDPNVASVNEEGVVTANSGGVARISAVDVFGCENSIDVSVSILSVNDEHLNPYTIYPNPVSYQLMIDGLTGGETIQVLDAIGKEINVNIEDGVIGVYGLPDGVYYLSVEDKSSKVISRFVKSSY